LLDEAVLVLITVRIAVRMSGFRRALVAFNGEEKVELRGLLYLYCFHRVLGKLCCDYNPYWTYNGCVSDCLRVLINQLSWPMYGPDRSLEITTGTK